MALHFSANQYNKSFDPKLLQNWEVAKQHRERPRAFDGFTQIVANNRGHLLPGVKRSRESPWGTFVGTWDLPLKIPGNSMTNSTARTFSAVQRLERCKTDGEIILKGHLKKCKIPDALPVKADKDSDQGLDKSAPLPPIPSDSKINLTKSDSARSGAKNPVPISSTSPKVLGSPKPITPNFDWPMPGSRAKSASPRILSPKVCSPKPPSPLTQENATTNAAVAGTMEPELQVMWPPPKSTEPVNEQVAA